jgi:hypothetical protein
MIWQTGDWEKAVVSASTEDKADNATPLHSLDRESSVLCPCDQTMSRAETMYSGAEETAALYGRRLSFDRFTLAGDPVFTPTTDLGVVEPHPFEKRARRKTIGGSDMV